MTEPHVPRGPVGGQSPPSDRLDSWKEIAAYLRRDVTTVQRWEKREDMPVHRHVHDRLGSVYAFRAELDAWARCRTVLDEATEKSRGDAAGPGQRAEAGAPAAPSPRVLRRRSARCRAAGRSLVALVWSAESRRRRTTLLLSGARFQQLTDFEGVEQAAAISRDGRFVAFQSDREGRMDVWADPGRDGSVLEPHPGQHAGAGEPLGAHARVLTGWNPGDVLGAQAQRLGPSGDLHLVGGAPRRRATALPARAWPSSTGRPTATRLAYHTPGPGDPTFVREPGVPEPRHLLTAPEGLHSHFPVWSPDQTFLVFVQGSLPDRLDLWRIPASGGTAERLTHHDAQLSHPVFVERQTLLYLMTDPDGSGPCNPEPRFCGRASNAASARVWTGSPRCRPARTGGGWWRRRPRRRPRFWRVPLDGTGGSCPGRSASRSPPATARYRGWDATRCSTCPPAAVATRCGSSRPAWPPSSGAAPRRASSVRRRWSAVASGLRSRFDAGTRGS